MFPFIIKYFGFLKFVPLLPHLFDAQLRLWMLVTAPLVLRCVDHIEAKVATWPGTSTTVHEYGGLQFNFQGKEIAHIHSNGLLDMLLSRKIKEQYLAEGRITDHHTFRNSGWISFYIRDFGDADYALELLKTAYLKIDGQHVFE
ncbi:MAG: DUF5519 family protein [Bacteroidota bacterium]|nr:DUF5519 family protein [Bacteroidota bacterium]